MIPHPPPIQDYELRNSKTLRFTANAAVSQQITFQNLLDTVLFAQGAAVQYDVFFAVKLKRVKVWSLPVVGQTNSVTIIFDGTVAGFVGDRQVHQDSSMGIEPAYLSVSPSKQSLASKFQISSANNAFFIECSAGSVIDVDLDFRSDVLGIPVGAQNVAVGATVGAIGYRGLDGLAAAGTKFTVPTSLNFV
jgi:hypothetical protein